MRNAVRAKIDASKKETPKKRRESRQDKEKRLEEEASTGNAIDRLSMLVAVRVGENLGVQFDGARPSETVKLIRGSAYGEDNHPVLTSRSTPDMGYFEINNKSKEFFCIKLLRKGGDQKFEVPRPSYLSGERKRKKGRERESDFIQDKGGGVIIFVSVYVCVTVLMYRELGREREFRIEEKVTRRARVYSTGVGRHYF